MLNSLVLNDCIFSTLEFLSMHCEEPLLKPLRGGTLPLYACGGFPEGWGFGGSLTPPPPHDPERRQALGRLHGRNSLPHAYFIVIN